MSLDVFHPATASWFASRFGAPTQPQRDAWPAIAAGRATLVAAPTGSGKTLAAFLWALDDLLRESLLEGALPDEVRVLYVSPLKALSHDIHANLEEPLAGLRDSAIAMGLGAPPIRAAVRTGDTPASERAAMLKRPPHVLVTTPESLFILVTSEGGRRMLSTVRSVIVDEIHAVAGTKRGAHLAFTLQRLEHVAERKLRRIGLSATQRPIDEVARFLVGTKNVAADGTPDCVIVDSGHRRAIDVGIELPSTALCAVLSNEQRADVHARIAQLANEHRTTLVFVNTRRAAERSAKALADILGEDAVTSHHGSLSRAQRLDAEKRLKEGRLRALVATSSLELGIDIGDVDLVVQVGTTSSISQFLQRVGRAGHGVGRTPKGRLFPVSRDELGEAAALMRALRAGELDRLLPPEAPLDILSQQIVAECAAEDWREDDLFELARATWPYRALQRSDFDAVVDMLAEGFTTRNGRAGARLHRDAVNGILRGRKGARLAAITSGGAIPDTAIFDVVLEPGGVKIGTLDEDFAIESLAGDVFLLGASSWRILRIENGRVLVEDARGQAPGVPFWLGEGPARTNELSLAVSHLMRDIEPLLGDEARAAAWLQEEAGLPPEAATQLASYLAETRAALTCLPTQDTVVLERFFDDAGGMQLIIHAPFGARILRAWGLALRKKFCRRFNFELQAAATEDAVLLSLGPTHSFPLDEVLSYLPSASARDTLVQALLASPMFGTRWRWNASRSLAILRQRGGRRTPPNILRMQSEDLLALVFPDQLACAENLTGPREVPDHPLVNQTLTDCLEEAMDLPGLMRVLQGIESGAIRVVARDLPAPSPLASEVLNANPYAFLDDAPLEERRARAVQQRRWAPAAAEDLAALDAAAIERVRDEAYPATGDEHELHDALALLGAMPESEGRARGLEATFDALRAGRRATRLVHGGTALWVAAERLPQALLAFAGATLQPEIAPPSRGAARAESREQALVEIVRGRLEALGPVTATRLAAELGLPVADAEVALLGLQSEGFVLQGRFTPGAGDVEWCERRLLARIHRATLDRLRREIEPVASGDFARFLARWQRVLPEHRAAGAEGLLAIIEQLAGFEAPASAWESDLLPSRVDRYDASMLDQLCLTGRVAWARLSPRRASREGRGSGPVRATPLALVPRASLGDWLAPDEGDAGTPSSDAQAALAALRSHGALFLEELAREAGLLQAATETALGELTGAGLVTCDGFAGLRALLQPSSERVPAWRRRLAPAATLAAAGRWSILRRPAAPSDVAGQQRRLEALAHAALRRWGVLLPRLAAHDELLPPWRDLAPVLRRLEARGEIRGGRFVALASGEQYALPEAVETLRAVRKESPTGSFLSISAADPLNLLGVVLPGRRVPALAGHRILWRDGEPIATLEASRVTWLTELEPSARWDAEKALRRGPSAARRHDAVGAPTA